MCILAYRANSSQEGTKPDDDILSSLFEEDTSLHPKPRQALEAATVSVNICYLSLHHSTLLRACVHGNNLVVIAKCREKIVLSLYHVSSHTELNGHQVPLFFSPPVSSHELTSYSTACSDRSSISSPVHVSLMLDYRPAITITRCPLPQSDIAETVHSVLSCPFLQQDLYEQLFGIEFSLARSTLVLIGCQNGYIIYFDTRGYCNSPPLSKQSEVASNVLYSLEQPVVGIHAVEIPEAPLARDDGMEVEQPHTTTPSCTAANALVFVGSRGKLVLCYQGRDKTGLANFTEFHVPGPIMSSLTVRGHSLCYSTPSGVYKICLKPECISKSEASEENSPLIIPHLQFRFPTQVSISPSPYLLSVQHCSEDLLRATVISITGRVSSFTVQPCKLAMEVSESSDGARKLKETMRAIQSTSEQTAAVERDLARLKSALVDLNEVMSLLQSQAESSETKPRPFSCMVQPATERVGVRGFRALVDLELQYSGVKRLGRGWSLIVHVQDTSTSQCRFYSIPLVGLSSNSSLHHRVVLDASIAKPLTFTVTSSLHYSTVHLQSSFTHPTHQGQVKHSAAKPNGVSIVLSTCSIDALDYIQPFQDLPLQLLQQTPQFSAQNTQQDKTYSLDLPLSSQAIKGPSSEPSDQKYREVLKHLLPQCVLESGALITTAKSAEIKVSSYNGCTVDLRVGEEGGEVKVNISTPAASHLVELVGCIQRRLREGSSGVGNEERSADFLSKKLTALKVCSMQLFVGLMFCFVSYVYSTVMYTHCVFLV